jgi:membrane associated rhomboid family serine protease
MFGPMLENVWGAKRFLLYYIICGLGAALIHSSIMYYDLHKLEIAKDNFLMNPTTQNLIIYGKEHGGLESDGIRQFQLNETNPYVIEKAKNDVKETFKKMTDIPMVGASGAVFGILLGYGMLFPNTVLMLMFPPIPIKAKYFVLFYGLFELYSGVHVIPGDNVAHFAHLGGMLFGFIMIKYWQRQRNTFY